MKTQRHSKSRAAPAPRRRRMPGTGSATTAPKPRLRRQRPEGHDLDEAVHVLELQNETLRDAQAELEEALQSYAQLYDLAPVGFLSMDQRGRIRRINIPGAALLARARRHVEGEHFASFIADNGEHGRFRRFLAECRESGDGYRSISAEFAVLRGDGIRRTVQLMSRQGDWRRTKNQLVAMTDVTERRQAEQALHSREGQLSAILGSATDAVVSVDGGKRIVYFNEAAARIFRCPADQAIGQRLSQFVHAGLETADIWHRQPGGPAIDGGPAGGLGELRGRRADGVEFPIEATLSAADTPGGRLFTVILRDISARRAAEVEKLFLLRISEHIRLADDAEEMMTRVASALGQHMGVSRCLFAAVEAEKDRFTVIDEFRVEGQPSMAGTFVMSAFSDSVVREALVGRIVRVDDVESDSRTSALAPNYRTLGVRAYVVVPLMRDDVMVAAMAVATAEVRAWSTEEMVLLSTVAERTWLAMEKLRLAGELQVSEARFRTMAELVPVFIYSITPDGLTDYANSRFREYTGLSEQKAAGEGWMAAVHREDRARVRQFWKEGLAGGRDFSFEFRLRDAARKYRWFRSAASPIADGEGKIGRWIGSLSDIDDLMRAQSSLSAVNEMLEERVVERTAALATANKELHREYKERQRLEDQMMQISEKERRSLGQDLHDGVCQQLSGLAYMAESLAHVVERKGLVTEAAEVEELAQLVRDATQQARDVARGLHPVDVDANGLVEALRDLAARSAAQGKTRCTLHCPAPAPVQDNEAAMHLFRIAQEAVVNATKHARARRIVIRIGIQDDALVLSVTDDGRGLPSDYEQSKGLGLRLMRHRSMVIGGVLTMGRRPQGGTFVKCMVPPKSSRG